MSAWGFPKNDTCLRTVLRYQAENLGKRNPKLALAEKESAYKILKSLPGDSGAFSSGSSREPSNLELTNAESSSAKVTRLTRDILIGHEVFDPDSVGLNKGLQKLSITHWTMFELTNIQEPVEAGFPPLL
ncbi:hypothetical protein VP01_2769g1 [Puccinia sorghi]|uniref:Uncharacterized protein n=1 Tax=Puccinia sorghi TaxID=27349 RepID=A0A0L6V2W6_9BASI|nr:hypothetical protein VP01_2769g1 [Puccinia sorghi]